VVRCNRGYGRVLVGLRVRIVGDMTLIVCASRAANQLLLTLYPS